MEMVQKLEVSSGRRGPPTPAGVFGGVPIPKLVAVVPVSDHLINPVSIKWLHPLSLNSPEMASANRVMYSSLWESGGGGEPSVKLSP